MNRSIRIKSPFPQCSPMWLLDRQPLIGRARTGFPLPMKLQNYLSLNLNLFATSSSLSHFLSHFLSSPVFILLCNLTLSPIFIFLSSSSRSVASAKIFFSSSYYPATQDLRAKHHEFPAYFALTSSLFSPIPSILPISSHLVLCSKSGLSPTNLVPSLLQSDTK